jgi:hypothetical protein
MMHELEALRVASIPKAQSGGGIEATSKGKLLRQVA